LEQCRETAYLVSACAIAAHVAVPEIASRSGTDAIGLKTLRPNVTVQLGAAHRSDNKYAESE